MAETETHEKVGEESGVGLTGEEDCSPEFAPVVKLTEVEIVKSDANEEIIWENKCKLYRYDEPVWKERGLGVAKILKHKDTKKQRFIMHEDKTFKLRSNHLIRPDTRLQEHGGNPKALVFSAIDFAEGTPHAESLCIRFGTAEKAAAFREKYEAAVEENAKHIAKRDGGGEESTQSTEAVALEAIEELAEEMDKKAKVVDGTEPEVSTTAVEANP